MFDARLVPCGRRGVSCGERRGLTRLCAACSGLDFLKLPSCGTHAPALTPAKAKLTVRANFKAYLSHTLRKLKYSYTNILYSSHRHALIDHFIGLHSGKSVLVCPRTAGS